MSEQITISRMPGETVRQFEAFSEYLSLGQNRSTKAVAARLGKHVSLIRRWAAANNWNARARDGDQALAATDPHRKCLSVTAYVTFSDIAVAAKEAADFAPVEKLNRRVQGLLEVAAQTVRDRLDLLAELDP